MFFQTTPKEWRTIIVDELCLVGGDVGRLCALLE